VVVFDVQPMVAFMMMWMMEAVETWKETSLGQTIFVSTFGRMVVW